MDDLTAGIRAQDRYVMIMVILGIAVCVVIMGLFLMNLSAKPPVVTHESYWILESYRDSTGILLPVIDGTEITAQFGNDGNLSGTSGCNTYSAAYLIYGKQIAVTPPVSTHQSCSAPGIMQQESAFLTDLPRAAYLQTGGNGMKVLNNESKILLTFHPA